MRIEKSNLILEENHKVSLKKEMELEYKDIDKFNSPQKVVQAIKDVFNLNKMAEEYIYLLCMTTDGEPISFFEISHGTYNMSIINPREIMIRALICGATDIILVHNHPSGNVMPSKEDIQMTKRIKDVCKLIGIGFTDHIIVGDENYYSFKQEDIIW